MRDRARSGEAESSAGGSLGSGAEVLGRAERPTLAVNLRREPYDVYIGRAGHGQDGYFGNPYTVKEHGQDALRLFHDYFMDRVYDDPEFQRRVLALKGKRLGCFCAPRPCHGDIIAGWLNLTDEERGV